MHKCRILCNWWIKRKNLSWCGRGLNLLVRRFPRLVGPNQRAIWDWKPLHHPWESCGGRMILSLSIQFRNKNHNNIISHHLTHFSSGVIYFSFSLFKFPCLSLFLKRSLYIHYCLKLRLEMPSQTIVQSPNFTPHQIRITYFLQSLD